MKRTKTAGYCYTKTAGIFLLADGMGGHPEGEVAAQMALQVISAMFSKKPNRDRRRGSLFQAIMAAHRQILRYATEKHLLDTPRTTIVAAIVQNWAGQLGALW